MKPMTPSPHQALDPQAVLDAHAGAPEEYGIPLGQSRDGRPIIGYRFGQGPAKVSLIGGCHADEPVGPAMLDHFAGYLATLENAHPLLNACTFFLVPHANPDGEAKNQPWVGEDFAEDPQTAHLDLTAYLRHAARELPGDDVEFGFPHSPSDEAARPENLAIAHFLDSAGPLSLHASFHGMSFAAGPWFLIEHSWADRTLAQRDGLRARVRELGYTLHDVDRGGEKGFFRIDEGFTSRPDSRAMRAHFEALGDTATADLFRPSSMEYARSLGGDPLTLVSEMPLFLAPEEFYRGEDIVRPPQLTALRHTALTKGPEAAEAKAHEIGVRAMPVADQMLLQLDFLRAGLEAAFAS